MSSSSSGPSLADPDWVGLFNDSDEEDMLFAHLNAEIDLIEEFGDEDPQDLVYIRGLRYTRVGRRVLCWLRSGDLLECALGDHEVEDMNWDTLPGDERRRRWIDAVRMTREAFQELFFFIDLYVLQQRLQKSLSEATLILSNALKLFTPLSFAITGGISDRTTARTRAHRCLSLAISPSDSLQIGGSFIKQSKIKSCCSGANLDESSRSLDDLPIVARPTDENHERKTRQTNELR